MHRAGQTPGALLASGLAAVAERPVDLGNVALPGARSDDLDRQVALVLADPAGCPDICVIMIGANDVTHRMPADPVGPAPVGGGAAAAHGGRGGGGRHLPGPGHDRAGVPAAALAGPARLRQLAAAQTIGVGGAGRAHGVAGRPAGPGVRGANPRELFGPDNYHPSAEGYATAAMAVLPTVCAALGLWPAEEERPDALRREGFLPVARAAAEAASEAGTEVAAAMPTGPRGPWALLKRRRRRRVSETEPTPSAQPR